ncbi:MAG: hypothetical protein CTY18_05295 [Methylomonas sp.]|nr:MAG: hypothetical protein CTY18_05295 [Methylomonas sp.]
MFIQLCINGSDTIIYGHWAFAGAVCYLLDIDDSSIDHMVYPKDLVAYAKKLCAEGRRTSTDGGDASPPAAPARLAR